MMNDCETNDVATLFSLIKTNKNALFIVIFILLHCWILFNFILLSNDMIKGDFSAKHLIPLPRYDFMRVPGSPLTEKVDAVNRLAADFAQVYFPSLAFFSLPQAYTKETLDPWHRPSRYAPAIHAMCKISLCKFTYGYASFLHMALQLLLFYISFYYAFRLLQVREYFWYGILLVNFCLFLTPVGLSWFERGQFSLYVTLSYLWFVLGIINKNAVYIFVSALFAYVKFTSLPLLFVISITGMLNAKNVADLKQNIRLILVFSSIIALLFLWYLDFGAYFIVGIMGQELSARPVDLSLAIMLPRSLVKAVPFILSILGLVHIKKYKHDFILLIPYLVGSGIILITYPTLAFDYSVPCLFCFVPLVLSWSKHPIIRNHPRGYLIKYLFPLFIISASFASTVLKYVKLFHFGWIIISFYLVSSFVFLCCPCFIYLSAKNGKEQGVSASIPV
jgi:hypothetical protein